MEKYVIFHIEGGLGKNVASTSLLKSIKEKYPDRKIVVMASWPEVFLNNPFVYRVYRIGVTPYFYDDYIKDKDTIILKQNPYDDTNHLLKKTSLIETWHKMYDLDYKKNEDVPQIYANLIQINQHERWKRERPILLLNTNGGPFGDNQQLYSWTRDMPPTISHAIVDKFSNQYHIIQVCKDKKQAIQHPNVEVVSEQMSNLEFFALLRVSWKRVLIDSALQHAAAAMQLPSIVFWIGTSPKVFGYDFHKNIVAKPPTEQVKHPDSYYFDYQLSGLSHECPYFDFNDMFDTKEVLDIIDKF